MLPLLLLLVPPLVDTEMKVYGIAIVRTGTDINEPVPMTVASDLSSFGFFQRQVCAHVLSTTLRPLGWEVCLLSTVQFILTN